MPPPEMDLGGAQMEALSLGLAAHLGLSAHLGLCGVERSSWKYLAKLAKLVSTGQLFAWLGRWKPVVNCSAEAPGTEKLPGCIWPQSATPSFCYSFSEATSDFSSKIAQPPLCSFLYRPVFVKFYYWSLKKKKTKSTLTVQ